MRFQFAPARKISPQAACKASPGAEDVPAGPEWAKAGPVQRGSRKRLSADPLVRPVDSSRFRSPFQRRGDLPSTPALRRLVIDGSPAPPARTAHNGPAGTPSALMIRQGVGQRTYFPATCVGRAAPSVSDLRAVHNFAEPSDAQREFFNAAICVGERNSAA